MPGICTLLCDLKQNDMNIDKFDKEILCKKNNSIWLAKQQICRMIRFIKTHFSAIAAPSAKVTAHQARHRISSASAVGAARGHIAGMMRFRMQIESVMKEVTFWAEPRALKSRESPRGTGGAGDRGPGGGGWLGLRVDHRRGYERGQGAGVRGRNHSGSAWGLKDLGASPNPFTLQMRKSEGPGTGKGLGQGHTAGTRCLDSQSGVGAEGSEHSE